MATIRVLIVLMATFGLLSCAAEQQSPVAGSIVVSGPYRLDSGDAVRVTVFEQPALSNTYSVDQSGVISMPLIGQVAARGRSTMELQSSIRQKLAARYLRDPDIAVEVSEYRPFFVHGAVKSAGRYAYLPGMTAETAIVVAGGFADRIYSPTVRVSRTVNGKTRSVMVPVSDPIRPGDTIFVPGRSDR